MLALFRFCRVLDGGKSGMMLNEKEFSAYSTQHNFAPMWKQDFGSKKRPKRHSDSKGEEHNAKDCLTWKDRLNRGLGKYIMDVLSTSAWKLWNSTIVDLDQSFQSKGVTLDADLCRPWEEAQHNSKCGENGVPEAKQRDLHKIRQHVWSMRKQHDDRVSKLDFREGHIEFRQDILRSLSKQFTSKPTVSDMETIMDEASIDRLRASFAYVHDSSIGKGWTRFPWNVAFRELCLIKARALGPHKATTIGFYERSKLHNRK
jgi:RNA-dependent RNA polymerase